MAGLGRGVAVDLDHRAVEGFDRRAKVDLDHGAVAGRPGLWSSGGSSSTSAGA